MKLLLKFYLIYFLEKYILMSVTQPFVVINLLGFEFAALREFFKIFLKRALQTKLGVL
nr:MAG TPA: hypothetical protein [Caudoviricetes sp.]